MSEWSGHREAKIHNFLVNCVIKEQMNIINAPDESGSEITEIQLAQERLTVAKDILRLFDEMAKVLARKGA